VTLTREVAVPEPAAPVAVRRHRQVARGTLVTGLTAIAATLAWVPFVTKPVSPDEGGFLLVASQWAPGGSLYGHYWVDRPPLLIGIFQLALAAGGAVGLRLIGIAAVVLSVLLAGHLCRRATDGIAAPSTLARATPVVLAGTFLATPLFGTTMVNGELLAVPLVLVGLVALVHADGPGSARTRTAWALMAGLAGAAAPMVKQNVVDVVVVAAVLIAQRLRHRQGREALRLGLGVLTGAGLAACACLLWAEQHGTGPGPLWNALVTFRAHAAEVIDHSSNGTSSGRLLLLLAAAGASAAPLLLAALALRLRRPLHPNGRARPDLRLPAVALLLWEVAAIGAGGSYWLHYLIGLVPGMVLLAVAAAQRPESWRRTTTVALAVSVFSAAVTTVGVAASQPADPTDAAVAAYLRAHGTRTDTVVVGFGHPDIVWDSGLPSPYDELWSLPVRVRDPRLADFRRTLTGPGAPTWVVVSGTSLATWGVNATSAQQVLERRYRQQTAIGDYVIYRLRAAAG
jgi:hypothetical protein